jgi:hypothetical protein
MFYSRPSIEPLGWDLAEFRPNGAFAFVGTTTDNRPVDIKYRSGWLQVWSGEPGAPSTDEERVLVAKIGPLYHGHMLPEQVCDVLGLTIKGQNLRLARKGDSKQRSMSRYSTGQVERLIGRVYIICLIMMLNCLYTIL